MLINYIVHSTSEDNEKEIVSGKFDALLSPKGIQQANSLKILLDKKPKQNWGIIFTSTLSRAINTAEIVFKNKIIKQDNRISEIDYGDFTHMNKKELDLIKKNYIIKAFPNGESYLNVEKRVKNFLEEYKNNEIITIISHQAPQFALEVLCNNITWQNVFDTDWRLYSPKKWQPFWKYYFNIN